MKNDVDWKKKECTDAYPDRVEISQCKGATAYQTVSLIGQCNFNMLDHSIILIEYQP